MQYTQNHKVHAFAYSTYEHYHCISVYNQVSVSLQKQFSNYIYV